MNITKLVIINFKTIRSATLEFAQKGPGVYFIRGENGAGKSSIFDALCWTFFGKTIRGAPGTEIEPWGSDEPTRVEVFMDDDVLIRTRNPITLRLNGNTISQEDLDTNLGITYDAFCLSVVIGQLSSMFFDLKAAQKEAFLTEALNLEYWKKLADESKKRQKKAESELADNRQLFGHWQGKVETFAALIDGTGDEQLEIARANTRIEHALASKKKLEKRIKAATRKRKRMTGELRHLDEVLQLEVQSAATHQLEIDKHSTTISENKGLLTALRRNKKFLKGSLKESHMECPTCLQEINTEEAHRQLTKLITEEEEILERIAVAAQHKANAVESLQDARTDLEEAQGNLHKARAERRQLADQIEERQESLDEVMGALSEARRDLKALQGKGEDLEARKQKAQLAMATAQKYVEISNRQVEQYKFWVDGFKDIRLFIVSDFLLELQTECNSYLGQLGLSGWRIDFGVAKQTKSKTVKKGFHTMVYSPESDSEVTWQSVSGGESQRLKLAGNMGLANLLANRCGVSANIEVWDEPTTYLSAKGLEDLMGAIRSRADGLNKQIWLIDHRTIDYPFDGTLTVAKTDSGSVLEEIS